jgi:hypothetical protein
MKAPATGDARVTRCAGGWRLATNKEGSGQEQTTTNHCALKAGERRPAERSAGDEKAKNDVDEEDKQKRGGL